MRLLLGIAAGATALCLAASAQDNGDLQKKMALMKADFDQMLRGAKVIGIEGAIMGPAVKGAPYSADEVHETTQTLADGTRIHNETKTTVARDSQGRVRRESPGQIMIWDGAGGTSYMLNQANQTGQKMQMHYMVQHDGPVPALPPDLATHTFQLDGSDPKQQIMVLKKDRAVVGGKADGARLQPQKDAKKETLGSQILEGVTCEGTRTTTTIEAGAIGNDRPIQVTEERWYSPELQVDLMVRRVDPRTGEDVVKLTNVKRIEPDPSLFTPPPGYQIK